MNMKQSFTIKVILLVLILAGIAFTFSNLISKNLDAGTIVVFGTYKKAGDENTCPGAASNCCLVFHVPDGGDGADDES